MSLENNVYELNIDIDDLIIDKKEIENSLGYTNQNIQEHFDSIINEIILELPNRCNIKAGYVIFDLKKDTKHKNGLYLGNIFFKMDKIVTGQLKKSEKAALFLCTIGPGMESWARELMQTGNTAYGYIVDIIASVTVESVTNYMHDYIGHEMLKQDYSITNRYSPGYCNWHVSEQHLLFSLLPKDFCGVKLSESALMQPIKSVSGVIGIGKEVKYREYICDTCEVKDCTYRVKKWN